MSVFDAELYVNLGRGGEVVGQYRYGVAMGVCPLETAYAGDINT